MTDTDLKKLCKRLKVPLLMYSTQSWRDDLHRLVAAVEAAERERCVALHCAMASPKPASTAATG